MSKILIVLPYSGPRFTGGLAVVNAQLAKALAACGHDVKLLTFKLTEVANAVEEDHGGAQICYIDDPEALAMTNPGGNEGEVDRKRLYAILNDNEYVLEAARRLGKWEPDYILGHSRFSGPAAIRLRDGKFTKAKVGYFLHSFPLVEGELLTGYPAFKGEALTDEARTQEEGQDRASACAKLEEERKWIHQADIVMAMGPLMRWGATLMLAGIASPRARVHEVISGVPTVVAGAVAPPPDSKDSVVLILSGRANAAVKGFEDIVAAACLLKSGHSQLSRTVLINVRGMGKASYKTPSREITHRTVQRWADGALWEGCEMKLPDGRIARMVKDKVVIEPASEEDGTPSFDKVRIDVLEMISQERVMGEYQAAHGILSAAYIEHFGLVPLEGLACGRPVLVSEFSGVGQFLASRYPDLSEDFVVNDFNIFVRPLNSSVLRSVKSDSFDARPNAWKDAIEKLVNNIDSLLKKAGKLKEKLESDYSMLHFSRSVVAAFDDKWINKTTRQTANGGIEEVPENQL